MLAAAPASKLFYLRMLPYYGMRRRYTSRRRADTTGGAYAGRQPRRTASDVCFYIFLAFARIIFDYYLIEYLYSIAFADAFDEAFTLAGLEAATPRYACNCWQSPQGFAGYKMQYSFLPPML